MATSSTAGDAPSVVPHDPAQASHQHVRKELGRTSQQLTDSIASVGGLDDDLAAAKAKYTYMQEVRGYVADLCDMLQARGAVDACRERGACRRGFRQWSRTLYACGGRTVPQHDCSMIPV